MQSRSLLVTAVLALLLGAAALASQAQVAATTGVPSFAISVVYVDFGIAGDPNDDCAYLEMSNPGGGLSVSDIRLLRSFREGSVCFDKVPGSLLKSEDTAETFPGNNLRVIPMNLKFVDANGNARYDYNDTLYLDPDGSPGLRPTSSSGTQVTPTIRLTPAGDQPAGTLVYSNHPDYYGSGQGAVVLPTPSVTWLEKDANTLFGPADEPYLLPADGPGYPAGSTIPLGALRLGEGFGTLVRPTTTTTTTTPTVTTATDPTTTEPTTSTPTTPSHTTSATPPLSTSTTGLPHGDVRTGPPTTTKSSPAGALAAAAALAAALALARRRLQA